jgi:hypothetical protein
MSPVYLLEIQPKPTFVSFGTFFEIMVATSQLHILHHLNRHIIAAQDIQ